jgi:hypothetical protein
MMIILLIIYLFEYLVEDNSPFLRNCHPNNVPSFIRRGKRLVEMIPKRYVCETCGTSNWLKSMSERRVEEYCVFYICRVANHTQKVLWKSKKQKKKN